MNKEMKKKRYQEVYNQNSNLLYSLGMNKIKLPESFIEIYQTYLKKFIIKIKVEFITTNF